MVSFLSVKRIFLFILDTIFAIPQRFLPFSKIFAIRFGKVPISSKLFEVIFAIIFTTDINFDRSNEDFGHDFCHIFAIFESLAAICR